MRIVGAPRLRSLWFAIIAFSAVMIFFSLDPAEAVSANISHSYKSATTVVKGSLVSLDPTRTNYIQPANTGNGSRLLGIVVASNDSLLAVNDSSGSAQVATSGNATMLASTLNGDLKLGDQVSVSPFNGVGMKAAPGAEVIGLAQTQLDASTPGVSRQTVTDREGKQRQIEVGLIQVSVDIRDNPVNQGSSQLAGLQKLVRNITGRTVSTTRIFAAMGVAVISMLALVTLIYASIYSSILAVGRNPLAKYAVFRTLWSVVAVAVLAALISGLVLFMLLR